MNHYQVLELQPTATETQIRRAYRRLVKQHHPDLHPELGDREQIVRINLAYEILSDRQSRQVYDRQFFDRPPESRGDRPSRRSTTQHSTRSSKTGLDPDQHWQQWLAQVYHRVNSSLEEILSSIEIEIDELSADPFDDRLLENFQSYLDHCCAQLEQAQVSFRSLRNPSPAASVAAHLYHCLNQVSDGLDEFYWFTQNYDDRYLHTGLELFRIAHRLRQEAQLALQEIYGRA